MSKESIFFKPVEQYGRDLNFYGSYVEDAAIYLSKLSGKDLDVCRQWVKDNTLPGRRFGLVDPKVRYLEKVSEGNRELRETTMSGYLKMVKDNNYIMSPTLTAYQHPDVDESVLAQYIQHGLKGRSANKKIMLKYKGEGNKLLAAIYNNRQNRNKIKNNSLSGAHGTTSSILFLKSAHSTLTSVCRSASSNTNANLERLLAGNRHYWSVDTAITNIVNTVRLADYDKIKAAVKFYGLVLPTAAYAKGLVKRATDLYWDSPTGTEKIDRLLDSLTPLELGAFCYAADLYSLANNNPDLVRRLLDGLCQMATEPVDDPLSYVKALGGDELALIGIVANPLLPVIMKNGKPTKDLWADETKNCANYGLIGATAKQILDTREHFALLFDAFWLSKSVAPTMANFPTSVRRVVVASDTDSAIFTNQQWTQWYVGEIEFGQRSFALAAATTYLASQYTVHVLATMSGNMGVAKQHMRLLEMKNEYAFKFFSLTSMAKHYYAAMAAQEGNVYPEDSPDWEIKGATLKNSNAPLKLIKQSDALIKRIAMTVMAGKKLKLREILQEIADAEHEIFRSMRKGDSNYFGSIQIKPAESYKLENSPYLHYLMWNEVFGPKFGVVTEPPYLAITVKLTVNNRTDMALWLEEWDPDMAQRMRDWMAKYNKDVIKTMHLPADLIQSVKIPDEIMSRMDIRGSIKNLMKSFYLILESLGYFLINDDATRLVFDDIPCSKTGEDNGRLAILKRHSGRA